MIIESTIILELMGLIFDLKWLFFSDYKVVGDAICKVSGSIVDVVFRRHYYQLIAGRE